MAVTIVNQWQGVISATDAEIVTNPTAGRMMLAVVATRVADGSAPVLTAGDVSRNYWQLLVDPFRFATSPNAAAQIQVEIWGCPAARFDGWPFELVYASASQITTSDTGSGGVNVIELTGVTGPITVDSVTLNTATASTTLAITVPAPTGGANCLMIGAAVTDVATAPTPSGTGWTALTGVTDTSPNVGIASAWREATTGGTVTFTGSSANWAGVAVAIKTAGATVAQPNPNWPAVEFLLGLGYDLSTPLSRVAWTNQTKRFKSLAGDRGIQAELGSATQGATTIILDNRDGAFTPRTAGSATANAAGTTSTIKVPDAQATNIFKGDFFRLAYSTGALKQLAVFQVTGTSSAGGTTTVTFTRADGTGVAAVATVSGDLYVGVPIDAYIPYRLVMTWNSQPYVVSSGWLRDIPIVYDGAAYSEAQAVGTDVLETLTAANPSALAGEILRRNPTHYWPFDDAQGAGYAANASGNSNAVLTQTVSKYGASPVTTADFGASTQDVDLGTTPPTALSLVGDNGTGWASNGQTSAEVTQKGYALVGAGIPDFPSISGGVTIFGFYLTVPAQDAVIAAASVDPTICIIRNTDPALSVGQGAVIKLSRDRTTSYPKITVWDKTTHAATTTTGATNQLGDGTWALSFDQTSWAIYSRGFQVMSGSANLVSSFSGIDVAGEADQFFHGRCGPGLFAHVAVFGRKLTSGEMSALDTAALTGEPLLELMSTRIRRKLNTVGWKGARVVNLSDAILGGEDAPSGTVADFAAEVAGYQDGLTFPDGAGQFQYRDRPMIAQQSPRATLGENAAGGEIPYQPGMSPSFTPAWIYNDVRVDNTANTLNLHDPQTTSLVAVDDTSAAKYNQRTLQRSTRFNDTYRAWDMAWWWLAKYAYPQKRVETVTIDAKADPTRWPFVLGVEVGDLVAVTKRHLGAPAYTIRCVVLRIQPRIIFGDDTSGSVTLTLGAATPPVPVLNDPALGIVGGSVLGV